MNDVTPSKLTHVLFFFFALFIFGSSFSIALAQTSLGLALLAFVVLIVVHRYNPFVSSLRRFYIFIALYLIWGVVSALMGATPGRSLYIMKEDWLFVIVPLGVFLMQNDKYRRRLITIFAAGVLLISLYGLLQHFFGLNWFKDTALTAAEGFGYKVRGNFSHRLTFGNYYATAALFFFGFAMARGDDLSHRQRRLFLLVSLLAMIVTLLSFSRGSILALVVGLLVAGGILGRNYLLGIIGSLAAAALVVALVMPGLAERFTHAAELELDPQYEGGRPFIWKKSLAIAGEHPIFGVGSGNFETEYATRLRPDIPYFRKHVHAHNDLINTVAVFGLPGFILFGGLWLTVFGYYVDGRRRGGFPDCDRYLLAALLGSTAFFVTSLSEATFADEEVRQLLMFVWAVGLWPWYNKSRDQRQRSGKRS